MPRAPATWGALRTTLLAPEKSETRDEAPLAGSETAINVVRPEDLGFTAGQCGGARVPAQAADASSASALARAASSTAYSASSIAAYAN
jgi:hypothetical protein